ncbi:hypothetical protein [Epilithonimonas zeae]|uniref:hypothetical protein n=1 Tax=Epilithonimonas zeae TaxID=1416779 RepID=UPI002010825F|nr:hypothetical protein [Epilithonimonas zeae]UQB67937.1 hypothetical protein KI430_12970 [Epilithonimonas zeae]
MNSYPRTCDGDFAFPIKIRNYAKDELLLLQGRKFVIIEQVEEDGKYLITLKEL